MDRTPLQATEIASLLHPPHVGSAWDILLSWSYLLDTFILGGGFVLCVVLWLGLREH